MSRTTLRRRWRRTKTGCWTCSFGERGCRVRIFEKRPNGGYVREVYLPNAGRSQKPLGTRDRDEAERLGKELLAQLLTGKAASATDPAGPLRLDLLCRRFMSECPAYLDNKPRTRADTEYRTPVLLGFFGPSRDVRTLSAADLAAYSSARRTGGIQLGDGRRTGPVRQRSVHADLGLLRTMLRWASTVRSEDGAPWLDRNPLEGMRFEREKNPIRPVATAERLEATKTALRKLALDAPTPRERDRWVRVELALVLASATGRRRGSIVALCWEDIDASAGTIRWRAEYDKKGQEWRIPAPPSLLEELRQFQVRLGVIGGRLFPSVRRPTEPMRPEMLTQWLTAAERAGKLPKLPGGLWHPYRRKWASERMHLPLKAVADAGGWKDTTTLLTSYQHSDEATLLAVMNGERGSFGRPLILQ